MFTVIICHKSVIKDFTNKYKIHLKPFLDNDNYVFCAWNPQGETLEEAVPELQKIVRVKKEWRAIVVADNHTKVLDIYKENPFDYVDSKRIPKRLDSAEQITEYREYVRNATEKALSNPLMKLSVWLGGSAVRIRPESPGKDILELEPASDEYKKYLKESNTSVEAMELAMARAHRFDSITDNFELSGEVYNPPKMVLTIAERAIDVNLKEAAYAWTRHTEYDYSTFIEDNLYSNKLRCVIYEMSRVKGEIRENDYFNLLVTVMIIAHNDIHSDVLKIGKVYSVTPVIDDVKMKELCNDYLFKLSATKDKLDKLRYRRRTELNKTIDDDRAEKEFEKESVIPVSVGKKYDVEKLLCEYDEIGLSTDCPGNEESYWNRQNKEIKKRFARFLRQPQRSIEKAVEGDFRAYDTIDDENVKLLTKYQKQDIIIKLLEEEQAMIETPTSKVFNKSEYFKQLDDKDEEIKDNIRKRMSRKSSVLVGIISLVLFFIGFIPLLISEFNNFGTGAMSVILISIAMAVVAVAVMITLFAFRQQLISKFKAFNNTMKSIFDEIVSSLGGFSDYLSHACNVKREFSVLDAIKNESYDYFKIYKKHEIDIDRCMYDITNLFSDYVDETYIPAEEPVPYNYNFDQPQNYSFDLPYSDTEKEIEFLQRGNIITIPVDFIKSIRLKREELYD